MNKIKAFITKITTRPFRDRMAAAALARSSISIKANPFGKPLFGP